MLRAARDGRELPYRPIEGAARRGGRAASLATSPSPSEGGRSRAGRR